MERLPIDPLLPKVLASLRHTSTLLITAPPGAGKTTRVPGALYGAGLAAKGEIVILEPRRLAARLAAARVAHELGERPGATVGYTVRYESLGSAKTRIRFVTEGILSRRIVQDPTLEGVSVVMLDEFHERHLTTDFALAYLRQLMRRQRPDLKLIVMSATLDSAPLSRFLEDAPVLSVEGSRFNVRISYEDRADDRLLEDKVARAAARLMHEQTDGDILVFLPGAAEIRKAGYALTALALKENLRIVPLHGDLPSAEQAAAVEPANQRKLILATNVAETSVTIPGVAAVIDSGLARFASHSPWSGLPVLRVGKISKSSAIQRAGRAGRTRDGCTLRLYTRADFESRPERDVPEIRRADLGEALLILHGSGITNARAFPWFEPPPDASLEAGEEMLRKLGAFDIEGRLTSTGKRMLRYPLHPRLARLIIEGENLGVVADALLLAALLSERDIRLESRPRFEHGLPEKIVHQSASSDLLELRDRFQEAARLDFLPRELRSLGLDPGAVERVRRARAQLEHLQERERIQPAGQTDSDEALRMAILAAFPDRVARRRAPNSQALLLSGGGSARLSEQSVVRGAQLMAAVEATERRGEKDARPDASVMVRLASAVEPEWLAAMFPEDLEERVELAWNESAGRVDEIRRTTYGSLTLEEIVQRAQPSERSARLLADAVLARDLACFPDSDEVASLKVRLELLMHCHPGEKFPPLDAERISAAVLDICLTKRDLNELKHVSLCERIGAGLSARQRDLLRRDAPERLPLGPRRTLKIHYESGKAPWVESRLQDFFRMKKTPAVCGGRIPLTVHLLAPNGRAVQVTQDLAGFWERHYPAVRRELQRRYPRHAWPDPSELSD